MRPRRVRFHLIVFCLSLAALPLAAESFWFADGARLSAISYDFATDTAHLAMQGITSPGQAFEFTAAATEPATGILWVVYFAHSDNRYRLGRLQVGAAVPEDVFTFPTSPFAPTFFAEFAPSGVLYLELWDPVVDRFSLVTFEPATLELTTVFTTAPTDPLRGLSFHPVDGKLYIAGAENCAVSCLNFIDTLTVPQHERERVWQSATSGSGEPLFSATGDLRILSYSFFRPVGDTLQWVENPASYPTPFGTQFLAVFSGSPAEGTLGCVPSASRACLHNRRFAIDVTYDASIFGGTAGPATPLVESDQSLKFSFFSPQNLELILKIVDGCSYNGHYWVYMSGLTNAGVTLRITDTITGEVFDADNPPGTAFAPVGNIEALACSL